MQCSRRLFEYLERGAAAGRSPLVVMGGRRAGKTYGIAQWLLLRAYNYGEHVLVVSVTSEQGRDGAYADFCTIAGGEFGRWFEIHKTPREIVCTFARVGRVGRITFASFDKPEKAKGNACDWVFINEANLFTKQHYVDVSVNARRGVILDYNPMGRFWIDEVVGADDILTLTWRDNIRHLTSAQVAWFEELKSRAERADATSLDVYFYRVYYCGEYGEWSGGVFTAENLPLVDDEVCVGELSKVSVFADPSALVGGDYFAMCVGGVDSLGRVVILDSFSRNYCERGEIVRVLQEWCLRYEVKDIYVESNGVGGLPGGFIEFGVNCGLPIVPFHSVGNKDKRITANYLNIVESVRVLRNENNAAFMEQVWSYGVKGTHDDNVDALNSLYLVLKIYT